MNVSTLSSASSALQQTQSAPAQRTRGGEASESAAQQRTEIESTENGAAAQPRINAQGQTTGQLLNVTA